MSLLPTQSQEYCKSGAMNLICFTCSEGGRERSMTWVAPKDLTRLELDLLAVVMILSNPDSFRNWSPKKSI